MKTYNICGDIMRDEIGMKKKKEKTGKRRKHQRGSLANDDT